MNITKTELKNELNLESESYILSVNKIEAIALKSKRKRSPSIP